MPESVREIICNEIRGVMDRLENGDAVIKVPRSKGLYERDGRSHFHESPEFFIQVGGSTHFRFPRENLVLMPGEVCIVAAGLPHYEEAHDGGTPFRNVVGFLGGNVPGIVVHVADKNARGHPGSIGGVSRKYPGAEQLFGYLTDAAEIKKLQMEVMEQSFRGLLAAHFGGVLYQIMYGSGDEQSVAWGKSALCKSLIHESLESPDLSVKWLASEIRCSPDYLSHLFHCEVGVTLKAYINRERIRRARVLLQTTGMNVAETARACGFSDPSYFTRVFKQICGVPPSIFARIS